MYKFIIGSIIIALAFYLMAVPLVQHYQAQDFLGEHDSEALLASEIQMTNSFAMMVIFLGLLIYVAFTDYHKKRS
jgi:hypothetical protein